MEDKLWLPILVLFLMLYAFLFVMKQMKIGGARSHGNKLPPGPPKFPIIGNLHQLGMLPHRTSQQLSKKYGPVMLFQLGSIPTIIVSSAETAKQVLRTCDVECCSRPLLATTRRLSYNYLDVAFCPYGNCWREMRKIFVHELFSVKRVRSFQFIREEEVALMINSISQSSCTGNLVNLSEMIMSLTANITCRVAFGTSTFRDHEIFNAHKFYKLVQEALRIMGILSTSDYFPYVGSIMDKITGQHGKLERIFHDFDIFYQKFIDDHLQFGWQKREDHEDVIDILLKIMKDQTGSSALQITHDHIKAILMNIFLAGVETIEAVLGWVMAELIRNPRVMKKAQEEIRNYIGKKGKVSESDIDQFHYLKLVVKEALRLRPPGTFLIPRESISQFKINGYNVYPKTRILVNVWAIGRDPKSWESPEQFYPERFIDSSIDVKGQHFEFLPFGAGRRICPGLNIGMLTVQLTMANLLYHFDWKLPNGLKEEDLNMEEAAGLTNYKKEPLLLVPTRCE